MVKLFFTLLCFTQSYSDSLRIENIDGKKFIIHQVDPKETLYSISRRYKVPITTIIELNMLSEGNLTVGKQLKIPYSIAPKKTAKSEPSQIISATHTVVAKETLYSIARQYNIKVRDLKTWNNFSNDYELKIGEELFIMQPYYKKTTNYSPDRNEVTLSESKSDSDEIKEQGIAEIMEGTDGNPKYLARHKFIKSGSIIKVRNTTNKKEVFVRVTDNLQTTSSKDVIIQLSKPAFERLGTVDKKIRVEITYYK